MTHGSDVGVIILAVGLVASASAMLLSVRMRDMSKGEAGRDAAAAGFCLPYATGRAQPDAPAEARHAALFRRRRGCGAPRRCSSSARSRSFAYPSASSTRSTPPSWAIRMRLRRSPCGSSRRWRFLTTRFPVRRFFLAHHARVRERQRRITGYVQVMAPQVNRLTLALIVLCLVAPRRLHDFHAGLAFALCYFNYELFGYELHRPAHAFALLAISGTLVCAWALAPVEPDDKLGAPF